MKRLGASALLLTLLACHWLDKPPVLVPVNISRNEGRSEFPACAVDSRGTVHVVWDDDTLKNNVTQISYSSKRSGDTWTTPVTLSNSTVDARLASVVVGPGDRVHVAWQDAPAFSPWVLVYRYKDPDGAWAEPETIAGSEQYVVPRIAVDGADQVHAVWLSGWQLFRLNYAMRTSDGRWTQRAVICDPADTVDVSWRPTLALDRAGNVYVAFNERAISGSHKEDVWFVSKPAGGSWTAPENVSNTGGGYGTPGVAVDDCGSVCVSWWDETCARLGGLFRMRSPTGTWGETRTLLACTTRTTRVYAALLSQCPDGTLYLPGKFCPPEEDRSGQAYILKPTGGEWSDTVVAGVIMLDPYGFDPEAVAIGNDGVVHQFAMGVPDTEHLDYPDIFCLEYELKDKAK